MLYLENGMDKIWHLLICKDQFGLQLIIALYSQTIQAMYCRNKILWLCSLTYIIVFS